MGDMKLSKFVATCAWFSVFVLSWCVLTKVVKADNLALNFFIFFLVVAVLASAVQMERKK